MFDLCRDGPPDCHFPNNGIRLPLAANPSHRAREIQRSIDGLALRCRWSERIKTKRLKNSFIENRYVFFIESLPQLVLLRLKCGVIVLLAGGFLFIQLSLNLEQLLKGTLRLHFRLQSGSC